MAAVCNTLLGVLLVIIPSKVFILTARTDRQHGSMHCFIPQTIWQNHIEVNLSFYSAYKSCSIFYENLQENMVLRHIDVFQCFQETSRENGFWHHNQLYHALSCNQAISTCCISCPTTGTLSWRRQTSELQLILLSEQQSQCPPVASPRSMTNGLTLTGVEHSSTWAHQIPHLAASMMTWQWC